jgi:aminoglycoside phosphotransferase (APT) family kinase protein
MIDAEYAGLIPWTESQLGGRVVSCERQGERRSGGRPAFFIDVDAGDRGLVKLYAPMSRGPTQSPVYTLAREHAVLEELHAAGIAVPAPLGHCPDPEGILLEQLEGDDDYSLITDPAQRDAIDRAFLGEIAKMHALDAARFEKRGFAAPTSAEEFALADLAHWEAGYERGILRPVPLVEFARGWLHRNVPAAPERPVLIQGDTGPGQFMYQGSTLVGIVDWEFAHLADPMLDLAQIRIRDFYNPGADMSRWMALYAELSGTPIDWPRLRYYTVKAMIITPLALAPVVQTMHPRTDHAEWYAQDLCYQRGTIEAIAEAIGSPLERPALPEPPPGEHAPLYELLEENLAHELGPAFDDGYFQYRTRLAGRLVRYARNVDRLGPAFGELELDDLGELLGRRPATSEDGAGAIAAFVASAGPEHDEALVHYFYRHAVRREALMAGALGAGEGATLQPLA